MTIAYVLLNCDLGSEEEVISKLKTIDEVKEINGIYGVYDILLKIESPTNESLRETISRKIRNIKWVRSTLTVICIEGQ